MCSVGQRAPFINVLSNDGKQHTVAQLEVWASRRWWELDMWVHVKNVLILVIFFGIFNFCLEVV